MSTFGQIFACRQRLERFLCHTAFRDDVIQGGAEFAGIVRDNDLRFRENPIKVQKIERLLIREVILKQRKKFSADL